MTQVLKRLEVLSFLPFLLGGCGKTLTNEELIRKAYLDCVEVSENKLRPLVNLVPSEEKVTWNESKDKVLLFTLHRYPSSYPDGQTITTSWGESWLCSFKEYQNWYVENKNNIKDPLLRTKQVLGMGEDSQNTYITSMWVNPNDVIRPAYETNPTKEMRLSFAEDVSETYKTWFASQYYYSYETKHLPWTRLGYTYDWSREAKDRYGLTEFLAWKNTTMTVDKTMLVTDLVKTFNN